MTIAYTLWKERSVGHSILTLLQCMCFTTIMFIFALRIAMTDDWISSPVTFLAGQLVLQYGIVYLRSTLRGKPIIKNTGIKKRRNCAGHFLKSFGACFVFCCVLHETPVGEHKAFAFAIKFLLLMVPLFASSLFMTKFLSVWSQNVWDETNRQRKKSQLLIPANQRSRRNSGRPAPNEDYVFPESSTTVNKCLCCFSSQLQEKNPPTMASPSASQQDNTPAVIWTPLQSGSQDPASKIDSQATIVSTKTAQIRTSTETQSSCSKMELQKAVPEADLTPSMVNPPEELETTVVPIEPDVQVVVADTQPLVETSNGLQKPVREADLTPSIVNPPKELETTVVSVEPDVQVVAADTQPLVETPIDQEMQLPKVLENTEQQAAPLSSETLSMVSSFGSSSSLLSNDFEIVTEHLLEASAKAKDLHAIVSGETPKSSM